MQKSLLATLFFSGGWICCFVDLLVSFVHRLFIGSRGEPSSAAASLAFLTLQILQKSRNLQKVESICGKPHFASFNNQDVFLNVNQESHTNILTSYIIWFSHWLWALALDSFVINSCWVLNQLIAPLRVWPRSASRQGTAWEREQANEWLEPTRDDQQMPSDAGFSKSVNSPKIGSWTLAYCSGVPVLRTIL